MSILKYFKWKHKDAALPLPDPVGPLSKDVPTSSIIEANNEVLKAIADQSTRKKKGPYIKVAPECKAKVAKYALEHGNCAAARKYSRELNENLNESTVRSWVKAYQAEWLKKRKLGDTDPSVDVIPSAKRGRPLLLGETLDNQVKAYIRTVRDAGGPITNAIVMAVGRAVVRKFDPSLLTENDGPLSLTPNWSKSLLYRINFVKRKGCSTAKPMVHDFEMVKVGFLNDILAVVKMEDIPSELILNWDHTPINIVPGSQWTMAQKGAKRIEMIGLDDKRQITAVVCGTLSGDFLPMQLIYTGKTTACLPTIKFPKDWLLSFTPNHWSNEEKTKEYLQSIIIPYIKTKQHESGLDDTFPALVIFDVFKGQTTEAMFQLLRDNNIYVVTIPANCTDKLQPMDLSVNKALKNSMKQQFSEWYSSIVYKNFSDEVPPPVDLRMSIMKPLGAQWIKNAFGHIKGNSTIITNGFAAAGITATLE